MVKLTDKLMDILDSRADTLSGQDIKLITESIVLSESMVTADELVEARKKQEAYMKMGQEYLYGGE